MPITSSAQLQQELNRIPSLNPRDIAEIVQSAHFGITGTLDGIYSKTFETKASQAEIERFLSAAGAHHPRYGGAVGGRLVLPNHYPGGGDPPCVPKDDYFCWSA